MGYSIEDIHELESFFAKADKSLSISLYPGITIIDLPKFIESHMEVLKANVGRSVFDVFYERMLLVKEKLSIEKKQK